MKVTIVEDDGDFGSPTGPPEPILVSVDMGGAVSWASGIDAQDAVRRLTRHLYEQGLGEWEARSADGYDYELVRLP
jgi:hypothetical protein